MNPPSLDYLVTHLITLLFVSLVVCVMSIFLHKNVPSSMQNLFNVLFLVILLIKRTFCVMILTFIEFRSLEMLSSKNILFFSTQYDSLHSPIIIFPLFSNSLARPPQDNSLVVAPIQELESGSKFLFSMKLRSNGSTNCYKPQLVVLGNKQEYELDYDKSFALVSKMTTARTLLALATS
ncbi:hypothetical protein CR513_49857, partial [Mucuna pruriens]